ncbi:MULTISPECIES: class I SAM-dependent methyltransferase [Cyanophyceae]|uniref:SAM-dependent methyltransferase n=1 Tax=Cyanophyceae TaxID=3028117 RepID=UPI00168436F4|nr:MULTISPECIES: class I SAM-dependent methyltransferase [Cyanophyceae]MBD1917484.1 class I SAM-dependent methyltransferase [Phormidium sp. FACHB-77]MBD2029641.1 class I SAM-dependent methyltransferase [Phormidium sp. FACHB-322]MBD2050902.1 class I SAM-dependent methyltransferase [Leptolyngbya sp. FACHB-60]
MPAPRPDIGFIPTPVDAMVAMLKLADLSPSDVVYDLGCGDGRLLLRAAVDYGVRGVGVDVDAALLLRAETRAEQEGVGDRLTFRQENLFETDFRDAMVVFIYLLPHLNLRLRPRLQAQLQPGSRIVTHMFDMGDWAPDRTLHLQPSEEDSVLYVWRIPDQKAPE